ncbi:N-acetyltransferase family protein [Siculibacillus lacustris]|uniref:N-acetyltransferase family protein n=1 Tax=Siculibacillus lacustris TaxID=1549641 RepID=A0A4Q9VPD3_9HYPH|nr:GNAT family N-acetyltransferase [Siculibacillus lacustris]TBW37581.1 N-acetyltransferase family protein [Siculibacillus lacustris]
MTTAASLPRLRLVTLADAPAIAAIYGRAVLTGCASFEIDPPDAAEMAARIAKIVDAGHPWLVAELDGAVVGYAYAGPYRPRPAYRHTVEDSIYVAEEAQGRGLGRWLLAALISAEEARGARQMIAVIGDSANTGSIGLHAALGFRHAGVFTSVGYKHGRWLDSVLMQRALGPGDETAPDAPPTAR